MAIAPPAYPPIRACPNKRIEQVELTVLALGLVEQIRKNDPTSDTPTGELACNTPPDVSDFRVRFISRLLQTREQEHPQKRTEC